LRSITMTQQPSDSRFSSCDIEIPTAACIGVMALIALRGGHLEGTSPSSSLA
jgi:hypothetical protein